MLNPNKLTKTKPKLKPSFYVCAYHCVQLSYTTQHGTVLIIFPPILQTIIIAQNAVYWRGGAGPKKHDSSCFMIILSNFNRVLRVECIVLLHSSINSSLQGKERKGNEEYLHSAFLHQGTHKALRHGSQSFTCKQHRARLSFVSVHQVAPPQQMRQQTSNCSRWCPW